MRNLLARLSQAAIVVIDAPPLLPVTDGAILAARTDGALVVISSGKTRDHHLEQAMEHLERVDAKTLGLIINREPQRKGVFGYGYGYGYGYGAAPAKATRTDRKDGTPKRRLSRTGK